MTNPNPHRPTTPEETAVDSTPDPAAVEPFGPGETMTSGRSAAILLAAAQLLAAGRRSAAVGGFALPVSRWLTELAGEVGAPGSEISDEMLGGLALAQVVLRAPETGPAYWARPAPTAPTPVRGPIPMCSTGPDGSREVVMVTDMRAWLDGQSGINLGRSARGEEHNTERGSE